MMGNMNGPKEAAIMVDPVLEIKGKVNQYKQYKPIQVNVREIGNMILITPGQHAYIKKPAHQTIQPRIQYSKVNILDGIPDGVNFFMFPVTDQNFGPD